MDAWQQLEKLPEGTKLIKLPDGWRIDYNDEVIYEVPGNLEIVSHFIEHFLEETRS